MDAASILALLMTDLKRSLALRGSEMPIRVLNQIERIVDDADALISKEEEAGGLASGW